MAHSSKSAAAGLLLCARRAGAIDQLQLQRRRCQRNRFVIVCMNADVVGSTAHQCRLRTGTCVVSDLQLVIRAEISVAFAADEIKSHTLCIIVYEDYTTERVFVVRLHYNRLATRSLLLQYLSPGCR